MAKVIEIPTPLMWKWKSDQLEKVKEQENPINKTKKLTLEEIKQLEEKLEQLKIQNLKSMNLL